jgi:cytochrome P450
MYLAMLTEKLSTAMLTKLVYNVMFRHRGIPTRFSWAATDLRWFFAYRTGYSLIYLQNLHKELGSLIPLESLTGPGDVVRIQPNHISFNSVAAYESIHGVRTTARKGEVYRKVMRTTPTSPLTLFAEPYLYLPSPELTCRDDKRHGFLRRLSNPLFSQKSLTEFEPTIKRYYKLFVDQIVNEANENDGVINITRFIDHLAFDVGAYKELC